MRGWGRAVAVALSIVAGAHPARAEVARAPHGIGFLVVDLDSGRELASSRAEWLDTPVPPGSVAKLATLAAALGDGIVTADTRLVCTRRLTLAGGRSAPCSHPPPRGALRAADAIAASCNSFVAAVARRMSRSRLSAGHVRLGLPPIGDREDLVAAAIGMGAGRVTPRRLIEVLRRAAEGPDAVRAGLGQAADTGTASAFGLAGLRAFAKTATSRMRSGRSLGLVVALLPRDRPSRALVVVVPGGSGADAATIGAGLAGRFPPTPARAAPTTAATPAAVPTSAVTSAAAPASAPQPVMPAPADVAPATAPAVAATPAVTSSASAAAAAATLAVAPLPAAPEALAAPAFAPRIGSPRADRRPGYDVQTLALEDYVAQVVSGETLRTTPAAARDAIAVAARTFAWANRGRHRGDGFDLCSLTHCQVTRPARPDARESAARTASRVLLAGGAAADVFYSAACGGTLDDAAAIAAPGRPMAWMRARRDPARVDEPVWTSLLPAATLEAALKDAGWRGSRLRNLRVEGDRDGRARRVHLDGLEPATLSVNEFRRLVGQRLGWQHVKSTAFSVRRTSAGFELRGKGSGHGVGLCLFGAAALARRGLAADDILAVYFDGLVLGRVADVPPSDPLTIDLRLPEAAGRDAPAIRALLARATRELAGTLRVSPPARVTVVMHPTAESYRRATGRAWWTTAATIWDGASAAIHTVPPEVLRRNGQLESTLRHELVHVLVDREHHARPLWYREGLAVLASGTGLDPIDDECPDDRAFTRPENAASLQRAYRRALGCVLRERRAAGAAPRLTPAAVSAPAALRR